MEWLEKAFEWALRLCYDLCGNYGLAIILFTVLSKVILLPISVWVQKNSIKMVKMQPEINMLKAQHFGDPDAIAEGPQWSRGYVDAHFCMPPIISICGSFAYSAHSQSE